MQHCLNKEYKDFEFFDVFDYEKTLEYFSKQNIRLTDFRLSKYYKRIKTIIDCYNEEYDLKENINIYIPSYYTFKSHPNLSDDITLYTNSNMIISICKDNGEIKYKLDFGNGNIINTKMINNSMIHDNIKIKRYNNYIFENYISMFKNRDKKYIKLSVKFRDFLRLKNIGIELANRNHIILSADTMVDIVLKYLSFI